METCLCWAIFYSRFSAEGLRVPSMRASSNHVFFSSRWHSLNQDPCLLSFHSFQLTLEGLREDGSLEYERLSHLHALEGSNFCNFASRVLGPHDTSKATHFWQLFDCFLLPHLILVSFIVLCILSSASTLSTFHSLFEAQDNSSTSLECPNQRCQSRIPPWTLHRLMMSVRPRHNATVPTPYNLIMLRPKLNH